MGLKRVVSALAWSILPHHVGERAVLALKLATLFFHSDWTCFGRDKCKQPWHETSQENFSPVTALNSISIFNFTFG
jgi:hypothetical protein